MLAAPSRMSWHELEHVGCALLTSARGVLILESEAANVRRLAGDVWIDDVALPREDDEGIEWEWSTCAVDGERLLAMRSDGCVVDVEGSAAPRLVETNRTPDPSDLLWLDPAETPARLTQITTELDRGTWVLEGKKWRRIKSKVPRDAELVGCVTPGGLFVYCDRELFRVTGATGWQRVVRFDRDDSADDLVPTRLAFEPRRGVILGVAGDALVALTPDGWRRVGDAPGDIVGLAIDTVGDRVIAASDDATFAHALGAFELQGWLPGAPREPTLREGRLEVTAEIYEPDRKRIGIRPGEQLIALLPPGLAVFDLSNGRLRASRLAPDVMPPFPVLFDAMRERLVSCRVHPDATARSSRLGGEPDFVQSPEIPTCTTCKQPMQFRAQLCEDIYDCYFGDAGRLYIFECERGCSAGVVGQS